MSAIVAEGLAVRLGGRQVVRDATFAVDAGELGVLAGPSGGGKSALLKALLGVRPRAARVEVRGRASLLGHDSLATPTRVLARSAGLLFQDAAVQLTQPDVASELAFRPENLGLAPRDVDARVEAAAGRFGLGDLLGRPVQGLSGGEAKRVALAALLAAEPDALLLDEPLGGLDAAWRAAVLRDLAREGRGRAVLVVEHRLAELRGLAARAWWLHEGATVRAAPPPPKVPRHGPRAAAREGEEPLVVAERLRVARDDRIVLDDADVAAGPGVTLLTGPNGAGKTTLLRCLAGLEPFEGTVRVAGLDPVREPPHRLARELAYVPQRADAMFSEASVHAELTFGPRHVHGRADPAALAALAGRLGLAHLLDRHPWTLSGGEQQRLALACALAHGPRVVLLDEPTVGLDAAGFAQVLAALRAVDPRVAVLVASHDPALAGLADRVLSLQGGRVRARPAPRTVEVPA